MPAIRSMTSAASKWIGNSSGSTLSLIAVSGLATLVLVILSALWAGAESDAAALDRQRRLVDGRLHDQLERVGQDIRLMSMGFASFNIAGQSLTGAELSAPGAGTVGISPRVSPVALFSKIVTKVFGFDKTFLVDAEGTLQLNVDADTVQQYRWVRPLLKPMMRAARAPGVDADDSALVQMMRVEGRPSIVGLVPVKQLPSFDPGIHSSKDAPPIYLIAIRFIDGAALDALSREQGLNGARFARAADPDDTEVAFQIEATATKEPIGFIIWKPDLPGSRVVTRLVPSLSAAALVIAVLFCALIARLRRSLAKLKESEQNARHLALHDVLTELPNRAMFAARLDEAVARVAEGGKPSAVALIDLDRFKAVNDTFGHAAGDELIRVAATRMRAVIRPQDLLARVGGDEFALLIDDIEDRDGTYTPILDSIVGHLSQPFVLCAGNVTASIGCSIGLAVLSENSHSASEILRAADVALYQVKTGGRGRWMAFEPSMERSKEMREALKSELQVVLSAGMPQQQHSRHQSSASGRSSAYGALELFYQTVHPANDTGHVSGAEALVRWRHSEHGLLSPDRFIAMAEESGLIHDLGHFVLEEACRAAAGWPAHTFIAVNVSPTQLRRRNFDANVLSVIEDSRLDPARLELELTESCLFNLDEQAHAALARLRAAGVKIALDDFGTGFSSLSHLIQIGIDRVKIDRSFVRLLGTQAKGAAIVSAVVGLSRNLGLATTAEGVETEAQKDFLLALGCSDLQGYLFSKPMPLNEVMPLVQPVPGWRMPA